MLCAAALSFSLAQTATVPAIPGMAEDLEATQAAVTWSLTSYLAAAAIATPVLGRLGDIFGRRELLIIALLVFAAGSIVAAVSQRVELVIIGRAIQGAGGAVFPLCFGIVREQAPARRMGADIGLVAAILGLGGALGLVVGGLLVDYASWQWIFWSGAGSASLAAFAIHVLVSPKRTVTGGRVDFGGAAALASALGSLLMAITFTSTWGWIDVRTTGLAGLAAVSLIAFVVLERRSSDPLLDLGTLRSRPVLVTNLATFLIGSVLFGTFLLVSQFAQVPRASGYGFGLSATYAGLVLVPGCVVMLAAGPLAGRRRTLDADAARRDLAAGSAATSVGLGLCAVAPTSPLLMSVWTSIALGGLGLVLAAISYLIVTLADGARAAEAAGVNLVVRTIGSALGAQIIATILASAPQTNGTPRGAAYTTAFAVCGAAGLMAAGAAGLLSSRSGRTRVSPARSRTRGGLP